MNDIEAYINKAFAGLVVADCPDLRQPTREEPREIIKEKRYTFAADKKNQHIDREEYTTGIGEKLEEERIVIFKAGISNPNITVQSLIKTLHKFPVALYLSKKNRREVCFAIHAELTRRGIAPNWRRDLTVKKAKWYSEAEFRFKLDAQIHDLQWILATWPPFSVHSKIFSEYSRMFSDWKFDYEQAERFVSAPHTFETKALNLGISEYHQLHLKTLRSTDVANAQKMLLAHRQKVKSELEKSVRLNPHSHRDALGLIDEWVDIWTAFEIASGSPTIAVTELLLIVGQANSMSRDRMKNKRDSINGILSKVKSQLLININRA